MPEVNQKHEPEDIQKLARIHPAAEALALMIQGVTVLSSCSHISQIITEAAVLVHFCSTSGGNSGGHQNSPEFWQNRILFCRNSARHNPISVMLCSGQPITGSGKPWW